MNPERRNSHFDLWWWRAWYLFFALSICWLAWCAWLSRPLALWTKGWVGWWTGDKVTCLPNWNFYARPGEGADIAQVNGDAVFRNKTGTFTELGHWTEDGERWTWAGWT